MDDYEFVRLCHCGEEVKSVRPLQDGIALTEGLSYNSLTPSSAEQTGGKFSIGPMRG
jgi:hypothetical protein